MPSSSARHLSQHDTDGATGGPVANDSSGLPQPNLALAPSRPHSVVTSMLRPTIAPDGKFQPEELQQWLEYAGSRLLALGISSPFPKEPTIAWPAYAQDKAEAYGYTGEKLRPARPGRFEIDLMDEILEFPSLVADIRTRRIINARALVAPVSDRYIYSWSKIAFMLHTSSSQVKRLHGLGLKEIVGKIPRTKIYSIRQRLAPHLT